MKITKRQLRRIIREADETLQARKISADKIVETVQSFMERPLTRDEVLTLRQIAFDIYSAGTIEEVPLFARR